MPDVLIVIDQQKAKEHPKWGPRNNRDAEKNIVRLLATWRARGWPIFHVRHDSTFPDSPFRPGQEGNDFSPLTAPLPGETVIAKGVTSAFIGTDLAVRLEALDRPPLVICGWLLANSVEATVRVGANLGYEIRLPADACWSCDKRDLTGRLWRARGRASAHLGAAERRIRHGDDGRGSSRTKSCKFSRNMTIISIGWRLD